jgi:hypothetical protein
MFCFGVGGLLVAAAHSPPLMHALAKGIGALVPSIGRNPAAREDQRDKLIGRAMVDGLGALVQDSTAPGETRTYRLDYGATAVVRPSSRVAYRVDGNAIDKATDLLTSRVTIDGTVVLTTSTTFTIRTRFAVIRAEHGQYAIQCVPFSHEMRLSVGTGNAEVFPNGATPAQGIHVTRGEYLVVPETGAPAISHDSTGFPGFGDTATVTVRKKP